MSPRGPTMCGASFHEKRMMEWKTDTCTCATCVIPVGGLCCRRWDVLIVLCPVPCWGCVDTAVAPERWFRNAAGTAVLGVFWGHVRGAACVLPREGVGGLRRT